MRRFLNVLAALVIAGGGTFLALNPSPARAGTSFICCGTGGCCTAPTCCVLPDGTCKDEC